MLQTHQQAGIPIVCFDRLLLIPVSVTGVVNLTVERSLLAQTGLVSGTCCRGGIDMEPETPFR